MDHRLNFKCAAGRCILQIPYKAFLPFGTLVSFYTGPLLLHQPISFTDWPLWWKPFACTVFHILVVLLCNPFRSLRSPSIHSIFLLDSKLGLIFEEFASSL